MSTHADSDRERPRALLTGASSGLGAHLAPKLAEQGYDLLLVARREDRLRELASRIQARTPAAKVEILAMDLSTPDAASRLAEQSPASTRLLVNCAGFGYSGPALQTPLETYQRMLSVNVMVLTELTYLFARKMEHTGGGTIFNVASTAAFSPIPYFSVYAATKAYVVRMSEALDFELRAKGVRVLAYCPGPTETEFADVSGMPGKKNPMMRLLYQDADTVTTHMVRSLRKDRETAIPGLRNRIVATLQRLSPRKLVRYFNAQAFKPR